MEDLEYEPRLTPLPSKSNLSSNYIAIWCIAIVVGLFVTTWDEPSRKVQTEKTYWKNIDPSRSRHEIVGYDYDNHLVEYVKYRGSEPFKLKVEYPTEVELRLANGTIIKTGMSSDEILDQMEFDVHELIEYMGEELR